MRRFSIAAAALLAAFVCQAQSFSELENKAQANRKITEFNDALKDASKAEKRATTVEAVEAIEKKLAAQDFMVEAWIQTHMADLSGQEDIMKKIVDYKAAREAFTVTLESKKEAVQAAENFDAAVAFISVQDTTYRKIYRNAVKYSATSHTAKMLEKTKAKEQILTAKVQQHYNNAVAAADIVPGLSDKLPELEEKYADLMSYSGKIQEAAYKPFIQRIKDYLMSLAAVTVILMFFSMIQSKISAAKQLKESKKKLEEALHKNDEEIPSI